MCETCETERMDKRPKCGYHIVRLYFFHVISMLTGWIGVILEHGIIQRSVIELMSIFASHRLYIYVCVVLVSLICLPAYGGK